jgi:thiol-disulfide isomerase/thioredoxin
MQKRPIRRLAAAVGAVVLALAAGLIVWQAGLPEGRSELSLIASFEAETLDGARLVVDDNLNRPLVINFWATWCEPCVVEMPRLEAAYQAGEDDGLVVIGVNNAEEAAVVRTWVAEYGISFPIVIDEFRELEALYQVRGFPTTIFIDREGRVQKRVEGIVSTETLARELKGIGVD